VLLLAEELLGRRLQQLLVLHDLDLGDAGHGERDALSRLHALAHGVQGHHLKKRGGLMRVILDGSVTRTSCERIFGVQILYISITLATVLLTAYSRLDVHYAHMQQQ
jgi:hypothetical protein